MVGINIILVLTFIISILVLVIGIIRKSKLFILLSIAVCMLLIDFILFLIFILIPSM